MTTPQLEKKKPPPPPPRPKTPAPTKASPPAYTRANLGLAKPKAAEVEKELQSGTFGENKTEKKYETTSGGEDRLAKSEQTTSVGAGIKQSTKLESGHTDGKTTTSTKTETEALLGAEAALKIIKTASDDEIKYAVEALARAGMFGKVEMSKAIQRGKASASMNANASGGMGVEGKMSAAAKVDRSGLIPALEATFEAGIKAGIWGEAGFQAMAKYGPLALAVTAKINGFLGASAEVSAKAYANFKEGIGLEGKAGAFAGAKSEGSVVAEMTLGPASLEVGTGYDAMAGAKAEAELKMSISFSGLSAEFKANAFAGAKFEGTANGKLKIMGKTIVSAKGKISVSAGAGGEVEGTFEIKGGKLKIGGSLAAALGVGGGVGAEFEIDFVELADVILAQLGELAKQSSDPVIKEVSPDYERKPLTDAAAILKQKKKGYEAVYESFLAYANKKLMGGEEGIKKERVQAIIASVAPTLRADFVHTETDQGIEEAARDAFQGMLKGIVVQHGYIRAFDPVAKTEVAELKKTKQQEEKWRAARDAVSDDFTKYCLKKSGTGENGIKQANVQAIITKHWKQLQAAFPGKEADDVVMFAATGMKDQYLTEFEVVGGKITKFTAPADKAETVKKGVQGDLATTSRKAAMVELGGKLTALRTKLVAKPDAATVDKADLDKAVQAATSKLKGPSGDPKVDDAIAAEITKAFTGIIDSVTVKDRKVTGMVQNGGGLAAARTKKDADAKQAAESHAVTAFGSALTGYLEQKTDGGKHGLKLEQVQARLDKATAKVKEWAATDAGATALKGAAEGALGAILKTIEIKNGTVTQFVVDEAAMTTRKQDRAANGKGRLEGGANDDNTRRQMVASAVRKEFASYAGKVRAAGEKAAESGTAPKVVLERGPLQEIIDKRTKTVRADVINEVGDEALVVAAKGAFGPMLKDISVKDLRITSLEAEKNFAVLAKSKREASAALLQAQADLTAELTTYAGSYTPTKTVVQKIVNKHKGKMNTDADELDLLLQLAAEKAMGAQVEKIEFVKTVVSALVLKKHSKTP